MSSQLDKLYREAVEDSEGRSRIKPSVGRGGWGPGDLNDSKTFDYTDQDNGGRPISWKRNPEADQTRQEDESWNEYKQRAWIPTWWEK